MGNLVLHSKLGSAQEIENPEAGSFNARDGFSNFQTAKFGDGTYATAGTQYIRYNSNGLSIEQGCIEMWCVFNNQNIVNGYYNSATPYGIRTLFGVNGASQDSVYNLQLRIYSSDYSAYGTLLIINGAYAITCANYSISAGTPFHIAVVWNRAGIDGGSDKARIYIDGAQKGATTTSFTSFTPDRIIIGNLFYNGTPSSYAFRNTGSGEECAIDNVKAWDYAKTDFSDRFVQGAGRPFCNKFNPFNF